MKIKLIEEQSVNRYKNIDQLLTKIIIEKEKMDCEHIIKCAKFGCHCKLCKAARKVNKLE